MRNLFVKGFMAAAAVVALASCSNDEEVVMTTPEGDATVTLGVSVSVPGTKAATTADQVNQDADFATITGISVVPMINGVRQSVIALGDITAGASSKTSWDEATIPSSVNGFRVYAGVPADVLNGITTSAFSYAAPETEDNAHSGLVTWMETNMAGKSLIGQYPLMYFANTDAGDGYYATQSESDWDQVVSWGDKSKNAIGTANNRVKIDGVQYGVGVLASGVAYRRDVTTNTAEEEACFGEASQSAGDTKYSALSLSEGQGMILKGIFIQDQPTAIDADLQGTDHSGVLVGAATNATLQTAKLSFDVNNRVGTANIYAVVMPEDNKEVTVSFQFQNNTGKSLYLKSGDEIVDGGYAYYSTTLTPNVNGNQDAENPLKIFDADYTTLLNANVINWSNGTPYLPQTTDVQIGVEIDVDWQKGLEYDVEI